MSAPRKTPEERARIIVATAPKILGQVLRCIADSRAPADCLHRLVHWIASERKLAESGAAVSDDELVAALRSAPFSETDFMRALASSPPSYLPVVPYATLEDVGLSDADAPQSAPVDVRKGKPS